MLARSTLLFGTLFTSFFAAGCSHPAPPKTTSPNGDWIAKSNENTKLLLDVTARFAPESAGRLGVAGVDDKIVDLFPGHAARARDANLTAVRELEKRAATEPNALVKQDLEILIHAAKLSIKRSQIDEDNLVPYANPTNIVLESALGLLDDQVEPARRQLFVKRLEKYADASKHQSLCELAEAEIIEGMKHDNLAMPAKIEVDKDLETAATMREGVGKLLVKYKIVGWEEPWHRLSDQLAAHDAFVKNTVLPKARTSFVLPPAVYAANLEKYGVEMSPSDLTAMAHAGFTKIQDEMKLVAVEVAKTKNLPNSDYREVLRALKQEPLADAVVLDHYKARLGEIEGIIRREKLLTLPTRPARIRVGTPAENAQQPAPHLNPARLIGNTGEQSEFVLPLEVPGAKAKYDDFTYQAASWTLTAHEARPGHELQFASMIERGVSNARAIFAFNSANVEGWGLYSERILYPFMPPEGKLVSLQLRLQRAVRAFIDPELQQGKWTFDSAKAFLMSEVGLSEPFAKSEVERYTFRAPGQATSYYYGFSKIEELRAEVETKLGPRFDAQRFHDAILAQGLLPPPLLRAAVLDALK